MSVRVRRAAMVLWLGVAVAAGAEPAIESVRIGTKDAPVLKVRDHGPVGRNVRVEWTFIGPGPAAKGDQLYSFCVPQNPARGSPLDTPILFTVDIETGRYSEYYPKTLSGAKMAPAPDLKDLKADRKLGADDLMDEEKTPAPTQLTPDWYWDKPTAAAPGAKRTVLIGTEKGEIVRFHPARGGFEEVLTAGGRIEAICELRERDIWAIIAPENLLIHGEPMFGIQKYAGLLPAAGAPGRPADLFGMSLSGTPGASGALIADKQGFLYTAIGPAPWRLFAIQEQKGKATVAPLLADQQIRDITFVPDPASPGVIVQAGKGQVTRSRYHLSGGRAEATANVPDLNTWRGYDLELDFDHEPPSIWVTKTGQPKRQYAFRYSRATVDDIKCMVLSADGKKIYGASYPNATIFEFDIGADRMWRRGAHYVHYQFLPDGDKLYSIGYWGIKLMLWDPAQPWTFDYDKHYFRKQYPGSASPWGSLDCNPQLICKFRYLRYMNLRRPAALARGADGRLYTGGRDMGINLDWQKSGYQDYGTGINYAGALFWFDPKEMTIGYEVGDDDYQRAFRHYAVRDLCAAGQGRYIVMTATRDSIPFEPVPEGTEPGQVFVWDTRERRFVHRSNPVAGSPRYVEEGAPGTVVIQYSGALVLFDLKQMQPVKIVKAPLSARFTTYGSPVRFERGPDERIYFYGHDKDGTALFRIDSRSGQVEAIARGPGISELSGTGHPLVFLPGSTFLFAKDRVYFGTNHLWSVPLDQITGPGVVATVVKEEAR